MLACAGYLFTMVADCVVSSVFTSDKKAGDLELEGGVGQGNGTKTCGTSRSQNQVHHMLWKVSKDLGLADVNLTHFMAISWNIWNDRNGVRHGEVPKTVSNLVLEATRIVEEFKALQDCHIPATNPLPTLWIPPMSTAYKANVDGAVFNALSTAGMGVLIRDDKGRVVGAISQNFMLLLDLWKLKQRPWRQLYCLQGT